MEAAYPGRLSILCCRSCRTTRPQPLFVRLLGLWDGGVELEEILYPGNFERVVDALVDSHQCETAAIFLAADVGADQGTDSGRINQRNSAEIEDEGFRLVLADLRLKSEHVYQDEGAGELKNPNSFGGTA
jgi:hypothetical protein